MAGINSYKTVQYYAGDNIIVTVEALDGYTRFIIRDISGTGPMYDSVSNFKCITDSDISWKDFVTNTTTWSFTPSVDHGSIVIPDGITSIASYFLAGLFIRGLTLPEGLTRIGEFAFSMSTEASGINSQDNGGALQEIVIPSTVTEIGKGAFSYCKYLKTIEFKNSNYELVDYQTNQNNKTWGIFYNPLNNGYNMDSKGRLITKVISSNKNILNFDWINKYNRYVTGNSVGKVYVYSENKNKIVELGLYNEGQIKVNINSKDKDYYLKLVSTTNQLASPVRVYINSKIYSIST